MTEAQRAETLRKSGGAVKGAATVISDRKRTALNVAGTAGRRGEAETYFQDSSRGFARAGIRV
ncbi:MAG: hypothetical protein ACLRSW_11105 [Christensenellaceae bacterium]